MNCHEMQQLLAFADRKAEELDQAERDALKTHLEKCPDCADLVQIERSADQTLAVAMRDVPVPAHLKQKVLKRLSAERGVVPWKTSLAAAAVLLIAVSGGVWYFQPPPVVSMTDLQEAGEFARGMDEKQVEEWFAERGLKIEVPREFEYQHLRQIAIVDFKNQRVAKLVFRNDRDRDRLASAEVIILPHSKFRIDTPRVETVRGGNFYRSSSDNFTYLIFYDGNLEQLYRHLSN